MKKLISFVLGAFFALSIFGFSFSDSVLDYLDNIGNNILFGYRPATDKISVDSITSTSVTIKSPVLRDEFSEIINNYILMYGPNTLSQLIADPTLISNTKEKSFSNLSLAGQSNFTMNLITSDSLNPNTIYYVMSIPKDSVGTLGEVSNELCFRLSDQLVGEGDECSNGSATTHGAGADMSLANISRNLNGNTLTLRWISVSGSDKVDIFLWDENAGTFSKLSTVNMSAESYSFNVTRNGEYIFKFIPDNGGTEIDYTFNILGLVDGNNPTPVNPNVTPVVVGPKENVIAILIGTIILYLAYKIVRRKA